MLTGMDMSDEYTTTAFKHITYLSETIGGRGSCTQNERAAGNYVAGELALLGAGDIGHQTFEAIPSTYWPFALGFLAALAGSTCALLVETRLALIVAAALNLSGAWAMLAETEFANHWARWLLPRRLSQNITAHLAPQSPVRARVVLCAHLDSHRTPVFYSSQFWFSIFSAVLALTFISMAGGVLLFTAGAVWDWPGTRLVSLFVMPIQVFALAMCLHADFTPFSPGANDDASGAGVILGLVHRLRVEPLKHTQVHLAFTGCEEVGSYGIQAYLEEYSGELGNQAVFIVLDEVGIGKIKYLSADGLVLKHRTHPQALRLAGEISSAHPELETVERVGLAYTDALSATKRGLISLTVCTEADPKSGSVSHWHQMSDTLDTLEPETLQRAHQFVWEILQEIDRQASG